MAKKKQKSKTERSTNAKKPKFKLSNQQRLIFGSFLIILSLLLFISFLSFFFTGEADQSALNEFASRNIKAQNWASKLGAWLGDFFVQRGFGVSAFIFAGLLFLSGTYLLVGTNKPKLLKHWFWGTLIALWLSVLFGFFAKTYPILGGTIGFEINSFLQDYIGKIGIVLLLILGLITYLAIRFKITVENFRILFKSAKSELKKDFKGIDPILQVDNNLSAEAEDIKSAYEIPLEDIEPSIKKQPSLKDKVKTEVAKDNLEMKIETVEEELSETDNLANKLVEDFGEFDPTLELSNYQFPSLDLLKKYNTEGITINQEELEEYKNKIVETLNNYNIGIASIKATIGPTVTLV